VAAYADARARLEAALDFYAERLAKAEAAAAGAAGARKAPKIPAQTLRVVPLAYGGWGTARYGLRPRKVDAVQHWSAWAEELRRRVAEAAGAAASKPTAAAFVSFRSRWTTAVAATALHSRDESVWVTR